MNADPRRRGALFVIAAPSGAGKTSLVKAVRERDPSLRFSVSHTTRKQRPNEVPGRDYHFIDLDEFNRLKDAGEFLENAQVFDNFYGTGRAQVEAHAQRRPRCDSRDRLAGRAAGTQGAARLRHRFSSCRRRAASWKHGCAIARPTARKSSRGVSGIPLRICRITRNSTESSSTRTSKSLSNSCSRSCGVAPVTGRISPELKPLLGELLA